MWQCTACTSVNEPASPVCETCQAPQRGASTSSSDAGPPRARKDRNATANPIAATGSIHPGRCTTVGSTGWFMALLRHPQPRLHEALWIVEERLAERYAAKEADALNVCRMDDDRLEEAVVHRDAMRSFFLTARTRACALQVLRDCPHISYLPTIRHIPALHACGVRARLAVAGAGGPEALFASTEKLQTMRDLLQELSAAADVVVRSSPTTPSEAIVLAALIDLSRMAAQWCATQTQDGACTTMHGAHVFEAQSEHVRTVIDLLCLVRTTAAHKLSEDVRAYVSLTIAELLSLYDRLLPSSTVIPSVERRTAFATMPICALSGGKLDARADGNRNIQLCGKLEVATVVAASYWNAIVAVH